MKSISQICWVGLVSVLILGCQGAGQDEPVGNPVCGNGVVEDGERPEGDYEQGAKGVDGGAVRLVGAFGDAVFTNGDA